MAGILLEVGDIIQLTALTFANNQEGENKFDYRVVASNGTGKTDLQAVAIWSLLASDNYVTVLPDEATYTGAYFRLIYRALLTLYPPGRYSVSGASPGGKPGDLIPSQVTAIISRETGVAGQGGRGRVFMPFVATTSVDTNGAMLEAARLLYQAVGDALMLDVTLGDDTDNVILQGGLFKGAGEPFLDNEFVFARREFGTMKKRGDRGQLNRRVP